MDPEDPPPNRVLAWVVPPEENTVTTPRAGARTFAAEDATIEIMGDGRGMRLRGTRGRPVVFPITFAQPNPQRDALLQAIAASGEWVTVRGVTPGMTKLNPDTFRNSRCLFIYRER